jgi:hypothetical protein
MRKLYAYNKLAETGSLTEVQKSLNHKYLTTTMTYLDIDTADIIKKLISEVSENEHSKSDVSAAADERDSKDGGTK